MTTFAVTSHPNIRLGLSTRALFPFLKSNLKVKLKKYNTINDLIEAINDESTTLRYSEVETIVSEILQIDKLLINYELNILKHPELTYIINPNIETSTVENNKLIIKKFKELYKSTNDKSIHNDLNLILGLDVSKICFDFISAQLVNYLKALNQNSLKIYIRKLNLHEINSSLEEAFKKESRLNEPLSGAIPEKEVNLDFLNFIKNLSDFGLKSRIHAYALNNETLSFINKIDSKFIYKMNRLIN